MRVTELTKYSAVQQNLNRNSEELQDLMIGLSNGKKLNKPSDDPVGAAKVQDFHTSIDHSKTLEKNISADKVWLNTTEATIQQITNSLKHVKVLALNGSNGASTKEHRDSLASEIKLITKDLLDLGNKKEGKLFLFSGTKTFTKPLEMRPSIVESNTRFFDTRIKSSEKIIPLDQDKPLAGIKPGSFTIFLNESLQTNPNETTSETKEVEKSTEEVGNNLPAKSEENSEIEDGKITEETELNPRSITITLDGNESLKEIIKKINTAAIAEQNYEEDLHSPSGFKAGIYAEIGIDNAVYLDPASGVNLQFGEDTTGFLKFMKFSTMGQTFKSSTETGDTELPQIEAIGIDPSVFEAIFDGYGKEEYLVRVMKGGTYGVAQFIVSDDGGKTWSQTKLLQKQNEIFNPEGKASNKVKLQFKAKGEPYFMEGLEFQFQGNEFVQYNGNEQIKEVIIDNGIKVALNINGRQLFYETPADEESVNIFDMLNRLQASLEDDDQLAVMKSLEDINRSINQVLSWRSQIGSTYKELEASEERIETNIDFKSEELSKLEDMDLAKGAIDLNNAELKRNVALDSAARLIQPTLINFLK